MRFSHITVEQTWHIIAKPLTQSHNSTIKPT
uniref:Uncharacterized protein n=1 Tax=Arundo donax TaxID=35708 RepID=A0A0A9EVV2_ARUDO